MSSTRQDGQLLWSGVLAAPTELLASMLALLEQTSFFNVLGKKGLSLINREGDEFAKALEARTRELSDMDRPELILQGLSKLEEIADVQPGYLAGSRDFHDLCGELASKAVDLKHEGDKEFDGDSLLDLMSWVMQEVLTQVEDRFEKLDKDKQKEVIQKLKDFVNSLPEEQQRAIKDSLEVDELTTEVIRQAVIKGSLGIGFGAAVSVGGFAFYTGASSVLAGLAGLVGLTLPFAAYTTMSSAIAVMANPLTIIFVVLGALAAGWWKGSQKIKQTLFPLVIVQLAAAAKLYEPAENTWETEAAVLARWHAAVRQMLEHEQALKKVIDQQNTCEKQLKATRAEVTGLGEQRKKGRRSIKTGWSDLRELALRNPKAVRKGSWGPAYTIYGERILKAQAQSKTSQSEPQAQGWLGGIADAMKEGYREAVAEHESSKAADELIEAMQQEGRHTPVDDAAAGRVLNGIREAEATLEPIKKKLEAAERRIERRSEKLKVIREAVAEARKQLETAEGQYFGLGQAARDWPDVVALPVQSQPVAPRLARALASPLVPSSEEEHLRSVLQGSRGDSAFAGLVVGDFLYDYLRIDPLVMEGIDFARAADLSNPLLFAAFADQQAGLMAQGEGDSLDRLQGYVAERVAAQHLAAEGYEVSFPETSNQAGWDLLVDGQPFQVKCTGFPDLIQEHLERYPDIPVIVNVEHAEAFADVPQVYVEPALSVTEIRAMTQAGLKDGAELADFELPWIALAVATTVELRDLYRHRTGYKEAITNIATSTVGRAAGGGLGAAAGSVLGSFLFGPAGTVIGGLSGAIGGGIGGGRWARAGRSLLIGDEAEAVRVAARNLAAQAVAEVPGKLRVWQAKRNVIAQLDVPAADAEGDVGLVRDWLLRRMDADAVYFRQRQRELESVAEAEEKKDPLELVRLVLDLVRRAAIHPHRLQKPYRKLFDALKEWRAAAAKLRTGDAAAAD